MHSPVRLWLVFAESQLRLSPCQQSAWVVWQLEECQEHLPLESGKQQVSHDQLMLACPPSPGPIGCSMASMDWHTPLAACPEVRLHNIKGLVEHTQACSLPGQRQAHL